MLCLCLSMSLLSSCCGLMSSMRLYDYAKWDKVYHFDFAIYKLASQLNKASSEYYLHSRQLESVAQCQSPEHYNDWTICYDPSKNAYMRCGYQRMSVYNKELAGQVDSSHHRCWPELQLIDLDRVKVADSLMVENDFGLIVIIGDQHAARLYTPAGVKVKKEKCLSKKKQEERAVAEFEKYIVEKIRRS